MNETMYSGHLWIGAPGTADHRVVATTDPVFSLLAAEKMRNDLGEALGDGEGGITHWEIYASKQGITRIWDSAND